MTEPVIPPMPDDMEQALASAPGPVREDAYKAWAQIMIIASTPDGIGQVSDREWKDLFYRAMGKPRPAKARKPSRKR